MKKQVPKQRAKRLTPKQRLAREQAYRAMADYVSAINDINNEFGTSFSAEELLSE